MKKIVAELLRDAMLANGLFDEDINLRDDYSGRGMYGKSTYALSGDFDMSDICVAIAQIYEDGEVQDKGIEPSDFTFARDSMGLGIVIY